MTVTLVSDLSEIAAGLPLRVEHALEDEVNGIADSARARVPVESGNLRDSIETIPYNEPGFIGFRVVAGEFYAHMVEFGSVHNKPAEPFLVPALEERRDRIVGAVEDALGDL